MEEIEIINDGSQLLVDTRLIAARLGVGHNDWMRNVIRTYQADAEEAFGVLRFENVKPTKGTKGGRPLTVCYLNEDQATFYMTLSRNTPEVVRLKRDLVSAFSKAKQLLREYISVEDIDRVGLRGLLKDDSRLRMSDQVKVYLEQIERYDDRKYRGVFFSRVHDAINIAVTGETAKQMRERLSALLNKNVSQGTLIRDYYPTEVLQRYISLCEATANFMIREELQPLTAVERAAEIVLYAGYLPQPIDFVEHIKFVRQRLTTGQGDLMLPDA